MVVPPRLVLTRTARLETLTPGYSLARLHRRSACVAKMVLQSSFSSASAHAHAAM